MKRITFIIIIFSFNFSQAQQFSSDTSFYSNHQPKLITNYKDGKLNGRLTAYYENGLPRRTAFFKEDKLEGEETYFYENGNPAEKSFYKNGLREGTAIAYYKNGIIKSKGAYKANKPSGERVYFNENGEPCNGDFVIYNDDGKIERTGKCIKGKPEGELKVYANGNLNMLVNFKNGKPHGYTYYYALNQKISSRELYNEGEFVREYDSKTDLFDWPDKKKFEIQSPEQPERIRKKTE
jgi:antitoxin component YwqK of YwqJK toxin-antitoxin module